MKEISPIEVPNGGKQYVLPGYEEELAKTSLKIRLDVNETKRPISVGAEKRIGEIIPILDYGFVYLVDYMGNDKAIEQAARVSNGPDARPIHETRGLLRYLMRHEHTSPYEMVELKFHAKMPIFVARQWVRHRTASINEQSARYSILDKEFYVPEPGDVAFQSLDNKQGRGEEVDPKDAEFVRKLIIQDALRDYDHYETMVNDYDIAKELARVDLNLNYYTQWYWKINLHNFFHFEKNRKDLHAQLEIRKYADAMGKIVEDSFPFAWEAFVDYQLEAIKLSKQEKLIIRSLIRDKGGFSEDEIVDLALKVGVGGKIGKDGKPKGELAETIEKFRKIGAVINKIK